MTVIVNLDTHAEPTITVAELALYWKVNERNVYYLIAKGALPAQRVGRLFRVKTADARAHGRIMPLSDVVIGESPFSL